MRLFCQQNIGGFIHSSVLAGVHSKVHRGREDYKKNSTNQTYLRHKQKEKFLANFVPDPNGLPKMFPSVDVWWSVVFGAIGGVITVLLVKMWENNGAPNLSKNTGQNLPQEHDERLG